MPKLPRRVLVVMSREPDRQLEDAATTERDKLIVRIIADSGLRLSELLGLPPTIWSKSGAERYLRVHGKGSKDRLVPVQPQLYHGCVASPTGDRRTSPRIGSSWPCDVTPSPAPTGRSPSGP